MEDNAKYKINKKAFTIFKRLPKLINILKQVEMFLKAHVSQQKISSTEHAANRQTCCSFSYKILTVPLN